MAPGDVDDILETATSRRAVLKTLAAEPHHRRELQAALDLSKTTCHRIVQSFDQEGLIRRTESGYALTPLGRIVADGVTRFETTVETASEMAPLLDLIEASDVEFDLGLVTDPDVGWEVKLDSSLTLDRGVERVKDADVLRVLDWTPVPELYLKEVFRVIAENGIRAESVYPKAEVETRLTDFPEAHADLASSDATAGYWVYDDVPTWGMSIYDDTLVELRAYEPESGAYVLEAHTDASRVVDWALDVFSTYRERADPLPAVDDLPDWGEYPN